MHIPLDFKETNPDILHQFIKDNPLGTLVSSVENDLDAIHIPFYLNLTDPNEVKLQGHIAKVNSLYKRCHDGDKVLIIFHGLNTYISPNFYPSKIKSEKVVPTWNYSVVHVKGSIIFKNEKEWIAEHINTLTHTHESATQKHPWAMSDAPEDYINKLLKAVVGMEITIESIIGNFKLSQNKSAEDYDGVIRGLKSSGNDVESLVASQIAHNKQLIV